jgi:DNA polymerase-3 subunit epsilon
MIVLSFDTETTSIPDWKSPSEGPDQPHLMSLAAILFDSESGYEFDAIDVIVKPDGWVSTPEAFAVHGITHEHAMAIGIPEHEALRQLRAMNSKAALRTAFNTTFDNRMIRICQKRYWPQDAEHEELMRSWKEDKQLYFCTMINARKVLGGKQPTLEEAYQGLLGKPLRTEGQTHNAMQDARACKDIFMELIRRGVTP